MNRLYSKNVRWLLSGTFVVMFGYGFVSFPGAPIRQCDAGFCGKHGTIYSEETYRKFVIWDRTLMAATSFVVIYSIVGWVLKKNGKL
jgi:hypothetical protein